MPCFLAAFGMLRLPVLADADQNTIIADHVTRVHHAIRYPTCCAPTASQQVKEASADGKIAHQGVLFLFALLIQTCAKLIGLLLEVHLLAEGPPDEGQGPARGAALTVLFRV